MALFARKSKPQSVPARPTAPPPSNGRVAAPASAGDLRVLEIGKDMLARARGHKSGLLSAKFYSDALMNWSMKDPNFKVQLFRFVDAFPMLRTPEDVFDHLKDYLSQPGVTVPGVIDAALKAGGLAKGLAAGQISKQITGMASKFILGTDAASALPNLKDLWNDGIAFSVDLLGEACVSDDEADAYQRKYLDLINNLPAQVAGWKPNPRLESDHLGAIPRTNVSIKISSLSARCDPIDTEGSIRELMRRLGPILEAASQRGVFVNFDMEQFSLKDLTLELFMRCCEQYTFEAGLAMQAYLKSGEADARRICEWAKRTGKTITVRLVKGAYWDYHVIHSEQMGWPCPVWTTKRETDACFERMTDIFLDASPRPESRPGVKLALGSHNVRSIAYALAGLERRSLPHAALELQMLHGMADQLKYAAADMGLRIREYVPVGEMIPGMAYLVRRLLENTSNESWLKAGFLDNADPAVLLASPHDPHGPGLNGSLGKATHPQDLSAIGPERHAMSPAVPGVGDGRPFFNEPFRDFSQRTVRDTFAAAVAAAKVPAIANDRTVEQARDMTARAAATFPAWRDTPALNRAAIIARAGTLMRQRRDTLAGVMIKESGKTWREADADVCEAIDFCEFYTRLAPRLFEPRRIGRFIGELDEVWHQPRGVCAVISPWNFPQAILCGMTVAALVTGNTVVAKPAEQTPGIASLLVSILHEAGVPREALHLCAGPGETVGAALVRVERVAIIAFTGSRDVGLDILSAAAPASPFRSPSSSPLPTAHAPLPSQLKRVICEMGGKNAVIVDTSADLDEAVLGIRQSAFGFQGQKCSACSRLIVVDPDGPQGPAIRHVIERLIGATKALVIGEQSAPGTDIGPVIDADAKAKCLSYIQKAQAEGCRLELAMPVPNGLEQRTGRHYVGPHIFSNVAPHHAIAADEIFGPVLAVMHAPSYEAALDLANTSPYKLTGGVFSRKPSHLALAKERFRVGNLYLNRGITGALVARQPFGGFGMSGGGSKAGGEEYLLHFLDPRASCENTLRRGFAPEL
ncbi:MAG: bifunctional proline dehydrogenase/L-glutamate gamma-semialdehyde dehydrogenase [Phycisphaerales bacterium]|nr:bifunctional proline dehydrogenase/L-glutamate gamma-semialdehyde dehydrogenase [Phycisphaerales bacterium]